MKVQTNFIQRTGSGISQDLKLETLEVFGEYRVNPSNFEAEISESWRRESEGLKARFRSRFYGRKIEAIGKKTIPFDVLAYLKNKGFPGWLTWLLPKAVRKAPVVAIHCELKAEYFLTAPEIAYVKGQHTALIQTQPETLTFKINPNETEEPIS